MHSFLRMFLLSFSFYLRAVFFFTSIVRYKYQPYLLGTKTCLAQAYVGFARRVLDGEYLRRSLTCYALLSPESTPPLIGCQTPCRCSNAMLVLQKKFNVD